MNVQNIRNSVNFWKITFPDYNENTRILNVAAQDAEDNIIKFQTNP